MAGEVAACVCARCTLCSLSLCVFGVRQCHEEQKGREVALYGCMQQGCRGTWARPSCPAPSPHLTSPPTPPPPPPRPTHPPQPESQLGKPAHAVILDRERQLVVVAVRGTANLKDVITDLAGTPAEWNGGHAHMAMAMSANGLYAKHKDLIVQLLNDNPG